MENHHKHMQKTILELVLGAGLLLIIFYYTGVGTTSYNGHSNREFNWRNRHFNRSCRTTSCQWNFNYEVLEGATDTDLNGFPPEGVYVIISSDTVTVANQTVDIGTADEGTESNGDGTNEGTESNGDGTNEGTESNGECTNEGTESGDETEDEEAVEE